jgi:hypothetical protein
MDEPKSPTGLSSQPGPQIKDCRQRMLCRWVAARWRRDVACKDRREGSKAVKSLITSQSNRMHLHSLLSSYKAASNEIVRLVNGRFAGCFDGNNRKRGYGRALTTIASNTYKCCFR